MSDRGAGEVATQDVLTLADDDWKCGRTSDALVSPCGRYRYWLTRQWGPGLRVCWVMLNPSTADASQDDPTIRRCIGFSKAWGYGSLIVVNLWAARATDPKALLTLGDPVGPDNAEAIDLAVNGSALVVAAWGSFADRMKVKGHMRLWPEASADAALVPTMCLDTTKDGHPRHPLYVKGDQPLVPFSRSEAGRALSRDFVPPASVGIGPVPPLSEKRED